MSSSHFEVLKPHSLLSPCVITDDDNDGFSDSNSGNFDDSYEEEKNTNLMIFE